MGGTDRHDDVKLAFAEGEFLRIAQSAIAAGSEGRPGQGLGHGIGGIQNHNLIAQAGQVLQQGENHQIQMPHQQQRQRRLADGIPAGLGEAVEELFRCGSDGKSSLRASGYFCAWWYIFFRNEEDQLLPVRGG